jgi:hypothetical protein
MRHARIRWRNVARVAGALAAVAAAVFVAPALLAPPEPAPLPDDVGLETGATGVAYEVPEETKPDREAVREARPHRPPDDPPRPVVPRNEHRGDDEPQDVSPGPAAAPAATTPPAPAPVAPAPAPAPTAVASAPPVPEPEPSSPVREEFGFEP